MFRAYSLHDHLRYGNDLHCDECCRKTNVVFVWTAYEMPYQTCSACSPAEFCPDAEYSMADIEVDQENMRLEF